MNLQDRLFSVIRDRDLLPTGAVLVVGVSGGTDSLALLHALAALYERASWKLHVATLDHGLRGEAGADDAHFVVETAQAWGLDVTAGYADVRALAAERHLSIETAARVARYDFLASVAHQTGTQQVAAAHHADDQVETLLHHLLRGAGLAGLGGMAYSAPLPGHPDLTLLRPLLGESRAALVAYCRQHGLHPREDASNADVTMTRNRLRRETLPYLRQLSPQIERHLLQLSEIAALEGDFVDAALHEAVAPHLTRTGNRILLPRAVFARLHPALQRRFIVWAAQALGSAGDVGYLHITRAVEVALNGVVGARAQLKGGVQFRVDYETLVVEHEQDAPGDDEPLLLENQMIPVELPAQVPVGEAWTFHASSEPDPNAVLLAIPVGAAVVLRGRLPGDRFAPPGLNGHTKKLNEWLIDHKVPQNLRAGLPLLVVNDVVAAIFWQGWTVAYDFRANLANLSTIYVKFNRNDDPTQR